MSKSELFVFDLEMNGLRAAFDDEFFPPYARLCCDAEGVLTPQEFLFDALLLNTWRLFSLRGNSLDCVCTCVNLV